MVVIEDDSALASLLIQSLQTRGYRTCRLDDGQDALALLGGARPEISAELIVLDVDLAGRGRSVRSASPGPRRRPEPNAGHHVTARAGEKEVLEALELGAFDHVAKPFSVPVLMQRVRRALRR